MALPDNMKRLLPLAFSALIGLAAVAMMRSYIQQKETALNQEWQRLKATYPEPVDVLVAAKDLSEGTVITQDLLKVGTVPERFMQPYAVRSPEEVIGLMTIAPIAEGEQLLLNKVRRPDQAPLGSTLAGVLEKGKRGVTMGADALSGVGGFVRPGDAVDILWTVSVPTGEQGGSQLVTWTLFQDVRVMAVGGQLIGKGAEERPSEDYTVTLAMTPQEASFLLFARENGKLQLSLRSKSETGRVAVDPANISTLMQKQLGLKLPEAQGTTTHEVEIYKGLNKESVVLKDSR